MARLTGLEVVSAVKYRFDWLVYFGRDDVQDVGLETGTAGSNLTFSSVTLYIQHVDIRLHN